MNTTTHQYLAYIFYSDKTIQDVLKQNYYVEIKEDVDLSFLKNGKSALEESVVLTKNNLEVLEQTKQMIFLKYPELKQEEELQRILKELEENLKYQSKKIQKEEQIINKYFKKTNTLIRKRQRKEG